MCDGVTDDFWDFMNSTEQAESNFSTESVMIKQLIDSVVNTFEKKVQFNVVGLKETIRLLKEQIISDALIEQSILSANLCRASADFDSISLAAAVRYASILKREMRNTKGGLQREREEKEVLLKQAKVLRDIRLFATQVALESRGQISFSLLAPGSQQFNRCAKAVMDNTKFSNSNSNSGETTLEDYKKHVKVRNVLKLRNVFLNDKIQAASQEHTNGKIKGLFCCFTKEHFCTFSVFGLNAQSISGRNPVDLNSFNDDIFKTVWYCLPPPQGRKLPTEFTNALKMAGVAQRKATKRNHLDLRFSRFSTLSNLREVSREDAESGLFLALCRVLIVQQRTIAQDISERDISDALATGCDCVYSTLTDEYVLLEPKFVLPEFFMQTQFPFPSTSTSTIPSSEATNSKPQTLQPEPTLEPTVDRLSILSRSLGSPCIEGLLSKPLGSDSKPVNLEEGSEVRQAVVEKQEIVMSVEQAVQDFLQCKNEWFITGAEGLQRKFLS